MTTAHARAVSRAFWPRLRTALMAAASGAVLLNLASPASAAPCVGDGGPNTCVIDLTNIGDTPHDGGGGTDKLEFNDGGETLNTTSTDFESGTGRFLNFETAQVVNGTTLNIVAVAGDVPVALAWTVSGILNVSGAGNAIGDASGVFVEGSGIFNVLESEIIGDLGGEAGGSVVIAATETLTAGGTSGITTFGGVISGGGGFTKAGGGEMVLVGGQSFGGPLAVTGGQLTLSGDNSISGAVTVAAGTLEIGHLGAIDNVSGVTINSNAQLTGVAAYAINAPVTINGRLTGNATITGDVTSNGGLQPGNTANDPSGIENPGQEMGQITINGNYTATGPSAYVGMFVDLDLALPANGTPGTTHDFLTINGNVTGSNPTFMFLVDFDDAADVGTATIGNGIQVMRITGTNNPGVFVQGNALNAGAYQYLLTYVANYAGTDDGYFLQSALRDEIVAHSAIVSAGQELLRHCFRDDQRVPDSPKGATYGRAWIGYHQGNTGFGLDTGIDMDQDYSCTSGGMDWRLGYGWFGGVSGGFGDSTADLVTAAGVGNLDGDARVIEVYAAFTSSSLFLNVSAGYADMDWIYTGALLGSAQATSGGFIGSAQAGVALDVDPFAVKLIGSLNYDDTNCGETCLGLAVVEDAGGLLEAKGTVRFDAVGFGGSVRPWAAVSYSDVLSNAVNAVTVGGIGTSIETNDALVSIDAGLQAYLDENLALFADGGYHEALNKDITGYKAGIGMKLYW